MIKRELYMSRIRPFIGTELVKVMTGIRRCGKSVMLELIQQELTESGVSRAQFISINFEDMSYSHLQTAQALHDEITKRAKEIGGKIYLFFDEIQEVKDWEKCINSFRVSLDCDIYITGSNAKLLSGELATYLGGRYVEFVIYPFSFGEFMELYRSIAPDASIQQCFQKYLLAGGMPYLANLRYADAPSKQYLHDLFNSVQLKDIVKRNKIRDVDLLERIIAYVIANVGTTFSATSLAKFLKNEHRTVAPETIAAKQRNSSGPSEDLARLAGRRLANISEPSRGMRLNAAQVKSMTGNDSINARFLHCNSFDFRPQFKLYINTNYLPSVDDMSLFSSNRVRVIPFDRHFEPQEQDPNLKHLFAEEDAKSAILNWLIAGWRLLQKEGLNSPAAVVEATKEYSHDSNKIALFAEDNLEPDANREVRTSEIYAHYKVWCEVNGCLPENSTNFKKSLQAIGTVVRKRPRDGSEKTTLLLGYRLK